MSSEAPVTRCDSMSKFPEAKWRAKKKQYVYIYRCLKEGNRGAVCLDPDSCPFRKGDISGGRD